MKTNNFPKMHVSLYVSDLKATIEFYNEFFGIPPAKIEPGYTKYMLDEPALIISFIENKERVNPGFGHLGFQVENLSLVTEYHNRVRMAGLETREEIGTSCCYAVQDKFWAVDPDGYQWEVYFFHSDSKFNDPKYAMSNASNCCSTTSENAPQQTSCC